MIIWKARYYLLGFVIWLPLLAVQRVRIHLNPDTKLVVDSPMQVAVTLPTSGKVRSLLAGKRSIPFRLSESLERGESQGEVAWVVQDSRLRDYTLLLGTADELYRPPVGVGDVFHYNRPNGLDPMTVGMKNDQAMAIDWDGDGRTDVIQRNLYSTALGEPWWGIYFWRNVGTNRAPQFARFVRLAANGKAIEDPYASYQLTDWKGDGLVDILSGVGSGAERGKLNVYRNSGQRDAQGLPVLSAGEPIAHQGGGEFTYGMRLFQWLSGTFDLFTLRLKVQYFPEPELNSTLYRHSRSAAGFGVGQPIALAGRTIYDEWPSTMFDVNGDGLRDMVGSTRSSADKPPKSCFVAWENTGTADVPAFGKASRCILDVSPEGFAIPAAAETPAFRGLLVGYMGGWLRYYAKLKGELWAHPKLLLAHGMPCSSGGYSSVEVADWDGDGDLDFIAGNEVGFVQLIENISKGGRVMFQTPRFIPLTTGGNVYAGRWQFINDADPERTLGQSKPAYVDWDGDGDLDLLVGNNSNRIAYFENIGTRKQPRFAPLEKLLHDGGEHFSFRSRPAPVDWNGDGIMGLVAGSAGPRERNDSADIAMMLYLRYRDGTGKLRLKQGVQLRLANGADVRTPIPYHHGYEVVDWDGDGDFDISACDFVEHQLA